MHDALVTDKRSSAARVAAAWLMVAVFFSVQNCFVRISRGGGINWQWDVYHEFVYWLTWAAFTPVVLYAARRWPLDREHLRRALPPHLGVMLAVAPIQISAAYVFHGTGLMLAGLLSGQEAMEWFSRQRAGVVWGSFAGCLYYWIIASIYWAAMYQRMYREGRVAAARLEASLVEARLSVLRGQLQPHFLFNTLNAIAVLTGEEPAKAHRMLLRLGDLLRISIDDDGRHEVPLSGELATLACYLDIQQVRFEERLKVTLDIQEAARDAAVPVLLLQPLVENAVRHGVDPNLAGGEIIIRARDDAEQLVIEVRDNGRGLRPDAEGTAVGIGLANTRARLAQLYGDRARLSLESTPEGGVRVMVTLPLRRIP